MKKTNAWFWNNQSDRKLSQFYHTKLADSGSEVSFYQLLNYSTDKTLCYITACIFCYNKTQMFDGCTKVSLFTTLPNWCHTHIPDYFQTLPKSAHQCNYPTKKSPKISEPRMINSILCNIKECLEPPRISQTAHSTAFQIQLCKLLKSINVVKKIM